MVHNTFVLAPSEKSGSTLLAWLLCRHPAYQDFKIKEWYALGHMLSACSWIPDEMAKHPWQATPEFVDSVRKWYHDLVNPQNHPYCGSKFVGFKNPQWLRLLFPDDPQIFIIRNPIDTYLSLKFFSKRKGFSPHTAANWVDFKFSELEHRLGKTNNHLIVYFEDLILDVQNQMDGVWQFLGLDAFELDLSGNHEIYQRFTGFDVSASRKHDPQSLVTDAVKRDRSLLEPTEFHEMKNAIEHIGLFDGIFSRYRNDFAQS